MIDLYIIRSAKKRIHEISTRLAGSGHGATVYGRHF